MNIYILASRLPARFSGLR